MVIIPIMGGSITVLVRPNDIAKLPWVGSHHFDVENFNKCDRLFIKFSGDIEMQKLILYNTQLHGMGINTPVTESDVYEMMDILENK